MNTEKINTPNEQDAPLLITAGMVPSNESLPAESPAEAQELIEVPEELKATPTERELGSKAVEVFHVPITLIHGESNGPVQVVDRNVPIVINNPGPQAYRQAAAQPDSPFTVIGR